MTSKIIIFACTVLVSMQFGFILGYRHGLARGVEMAVEHTIKETIKVLGVGFEKMGMKDQFKAVVGSVFDNGKLNLWEEEEEK